MSYRLIDSNAIAIKYPEVNEMPCVFANLPDGLNGQFIDAQSHLIPEIQNGIRATDANDVYSCGMRNGMRWCMSLIDGKEPLYENCPSAQLEERTEERMETHACDCISRQAAIDVVDKYFKMIELNGDICIDGLISLPSAQPERKRGKWKTVYLDHVSMEIRPKVSYCSECNQCIAYPTNFCPNCGADMRGEQDE